MQALRNCLEDSFTYICTTTAELRLNIVITDTQNTKGSVFLHFIVKLIKYLSFFYQQTGLGNGFAFVQGSTLKHLTVVSEWILLCLLKPLWTDVKTK